MLLRNYYKAVALFMEGSSSSTKIMFKSYGGYDLAPGNYDLGIRYLTPTKGSASAIASMGSIKTTLMSSSAGIIIGTGDTPPTFDDYCLAGNMITAISSSVATSFDCDDSGATITALCTITNSDNNAFTIREVGLYGKAKGNNYDSDAVLVERTVLDSPLTIEAGSVGQLTYTIKLNYPT